MSDDGPSSVQHVAARDAVLAEVAGWLAGRDAQPALLVGVDGRDGAGKTVFADELAAALGVRGVAVVQVSIDRFHHRQVVRYRRGRRSPDGFYLDSYDLEAFRRGVLEPLEAGGDRRVVLGVHDVDTDRPLPAEYREVPVGAVVVVDGIFLHRPELRDAWGATVYLDVSAGTGFARCAAREGVAADLHDPRNHRYLEGQRRYHEACRPAQLATWVIDNEVLAAPRILRRPGP